MNPLRLYLYKEKIHSLLRNFNFLDKHLQNEFQWIENLYNMSPVNKVIHTIENFQMKNNVQDILSVKNSLQAMVLSIRYASCILWEMATAQGNKWLDTIIYTLQKCWN